MIRANPLLPGLALSLGRRAARIKTGMALDTQEHHAFEHEEGRSPVWIGMAWGVVSLLGGAGEQASQHSVGVPVNGGC